MPLWLLLLILWILIRDDEGMPKPVDTIHTTWGDFTTSGGFTEGAPMPWLGKNDPSPGGYRWDASAQKWILGGSVNAGQQTQLPVQNATGTVGVDITVGAADGVARF